MENWLGSAVNHIQGWATVRESYSRALGQGFLTGDVHPEPHVAVGVHEHRLHRGRRYRHGVHLELERRRGVCGRRWVG